MKRRGGPIQQWVDSIPSPSIDIQIDCGNSSDLTPPSTPEHSKSLVSNDVPVMAVSSSISLPSSPAITMTSIPSPGLHSRLVRDPSLQSDSSHCSSVESLLELRKADPEAVLLGLGFGGCANTAQDNGPLSRIPKRFLQPSKLKGITINDFVKQQQETNESIDSTSLGYRGLTGSPYVAPSEIVQKIMERLREHESHELDAYTAYNSETFSPIPVQQNNNRLSVLSPDNREFLERQRSKSPDMTHKRMIIGEKSFAFSGDGDLIEINQQQLDADNQNYLSERVHSSTPRNTNAESKQYHDESHISESSDICGMTPITWDSSMRDTDVNSDSRDTSDTLREPLSPSKDNANQTCRYNSINSNSGFADVSSQSLNSTRRASDSSCDTKSNQICFDEGRRFSDGIIKTNNDRSKRNKNIKRSLQRQSRIYETDSFPDIDQADSELMNNFNVSDGPSNSNEHQEINDLVDNPSESTNDETKTNRKYTYCDSNSPHNCCKNESMGRICKHDGNSKKCCYNKRKDGYWRKMRKIMEKNEKLENMVVKSRREMAEIREMLNSVLSVRMEHGF